MTDETIKFIQHITGFTKDEIIIKYNDFLKPADCTHHWTYVTTMFGSYYQCSFCSIQVATDDDKPRVSSL